MATVNPQNTQAKGLYGQFGSLVAKSCPTLAIPWTVACQAPLSVGFSRQEYWSALPFPSPGDLPDPGIEPGSLALQVDDLPTKLRGKNCVLTDGDIQPQQTIEASQHQR